MDATAPIAITGHPDHMAGFRRAVRVSIIANVAVGLALVFAPYYVVAWLGFGFVHPLEWVRYAGFFILVITGCYVPLLINPLASRYLAVYAIVLRGLFVVFFALLGGAFWWFAVYDAAFGLWLGRAFWTGYRREIMAKP